MSPDNQDSTNVYYTLDNVCVMGPGCKLHTHKHAIVPSNEIGITKYNFDIANTELDPHFNYYFTNNGQLIQAEKQIVKINFHSVDQKNITFRESDTIKLTDLKHLYKGDNRLASEFITIHPKKELINNSPEMNDLTGGLIASLMAAFTITYLIKSFNDWYEMIYKIRLLILSK
jgi:hypothetical protein